jgi:SAM-dependent MidA family methyltransferase
MQAYRPSSLPEPDPKTAAHSAEAASWIRDRIGEAGGSISFAEYMHHALYAPGLGYYTAGSTKFGEAGDFITAPEVSSIFGRVLARQCAEVLAQVEGGAILEYGAGSGKLAVDMLRALEELDALPASYLILEVSPDLRERQEVYVRERLPQFAELVAWIDDVPDSHRGVIVANEVLDSMPVERFVRRDEGVMQVRVMAADGGFEFIEMPAPAHLAVYVTNVEKHLGTQLPDGYTSEVCLAFGPWIGGMAHALREGVAFLFDYGLSRREYYAPDRSDGWLRCHFRHFAHDNPLILPGVQDLTAWVDFTSVATVAVVQSLEVAGYATQAQFMLGGGLDAEMQGFDTLPLEEQVALSGKVKTLTLPGEMGERFKCLALSKGAITTPSAFRRADRAHTL